MTKDVNEMQQLFHFVCDNMQKKMSNDNQYANMKLYDAIFAALT